MNKQRLFRADGGISVIFTPADKPALRAVLDMAYSYTDKCTYNKRKCDRAFFACAKPAQVVSAVKDVVRRAIGPQFQGMETKTVGTDGVYVLTNGEYRFDAKDAVEQLKAVAAFAQGHADTTSADEHLPEGLLQPFGKKNYTANISYHIPFDMAAWEARHATTAAVQTSDSQAATLKAQADQQQAQADKEKAEADKEKAKASVMQFLPWIMGGAVVVVAVIVIVKLRK